MAGRAKDEDPKGNRVGFWLDGDEQEAIDRYRRKAGPAGDPLTRSEYAKRALLEKMARDAEEDAVSFRTKIEHQK